MVTKDEPWIDSSNVVSMFPTFVWNIQIRQDNAERLNANILSALCEMRRDLPTLVDGEAWQSTQAMHELEAFQELGMYVRSAVKSVLQFLKIGYEDFETTGCWANIQAKGASHAVHSHPNNFLSGVYYVQTHPGADTVNFHDPRNQTAVIRPPVTELTAENTDQVVVRVSNGTLLVFPSYLQHYVSPNTSNDERVSVSFNVMFSSFTENLSKPLW